MQYLTVVRSLEKQFKGFTLQHVDRNKNEEVDALAKAAAKAKAPKASSSKRTRKEESSEDDSDLEILEVFPAKKKKTSGESPVFSCLFPAKTPLFLAAPVVASRSRAAASSSRVGRKYSLPSPMLS